MTHRMIFIVGSQAEQSRGSSLVQEAEQVSSVTHEEIIRTANDSYLSIPMTDNSSFAIMQRLNTLGLVAALKHAVIS